ncbi:hypothetical protein MFLAVUS_000193 [Mucor flavus]|uniref:Cas12f1-like TNB domain-containing protein n=1 Tax=Mucor flavus TaxID=439312 RepID=A0ABP9YJ16_9FUNG
MNVKPAKMYLSARSKGDVVDEDTSLEKFSGGFEYSDDNEGYYNDNTVADDNMVNDDTEDFVENTQASTSFFTSILNMERNDSDHYSSSEDFSDSDSDGHDLRFLEAERQITTYKTANLERFTEYVRSVLDSLDILLRFYDHRFTALRLLNYIGRQCADFEMVNIFVSGGKKYLKREFKQTDDGISLIALEDAVFPTSMKGTFPGLARRLEKVLKKSKNKGLLVTVPVTEYMTSRTCSNCSGNNTEDVRVDGVSLFGVLHCLNRSFNTLWRRDINASRNMHRISYRR